MDDRKEHLKSLVTNMAHGRTDAATTDFHSYLQLKMRELVNKNESQQINDEADE